MPCFGMVQFRQLQTLGEQTSDRLSLYISFYLCIGISNLKKSLKKNPKNINNNNNNKQNKKNKTKTKATSKSGGDKVEGSGIGTNRISLVCEMNP